MGNGTYPLMFIGTVFEHRWKWTLVLAFSTGNNVCLLHLSLHSPCQLTRPLLSPTVNLTVCQTAYPCYWHYSFYVNSGWLAEICICYKSRLAKNETDDLIITPPKTVLFLIAGTLHGRHVHARFELSDWSFLSLYVYITQINTLIRWPAVHECIKYKRLFFAWLSISLVEYFQCEWKNNT